MLVVVGLLVGLSVSQISVPTQTRTILDHSVQRVELSSSRGTDVRFQVLSLPVSSPGSPNEGLRPGVMTASSGYRPVTVAPLKWVHASKQLYTDNREMKYNAQALLVKDIYPNYGDLPGEWLSQHGEENWVIMEIPEVHDASSITIWETFNPGGVSEVTFLSKTGNQQVVYLAGWRCDRSKSPSGAVALTIAFSPLPFDAHYVKIKVDATEAWRGIDSFEVKGLETMATKLPGELVNNILSFDPPADKPFGCDEFKYIANAGSGWSNPGTIKICYSCPKNAGQICSGRGTCSEARCQCPAGWAGQTCEIPLCPMHGGQMCSGRGTCSVSNGVPTCVCPHGWQGAACETSLIARYCYACNDPHYVSFWGHYFDLYITGEWLLHYNPYMSGPVLQITMLVNWLFVDGGAVRYGPYFSGTHFRGGSSQHQCNWGHWGWHAHPNGLVAYTSSWYFESSVGGLFSYWMNSGCFGLSAMTQYGAWGMCNYNGPWTVPGGCSIYGCQKCTGDYLMTLMKEKERITPKIKANGKPGPGSGNFPLTFISKLTDEVKHGETEKALKELEIPVPSAMKGPEMFIESKLKLKGAALPHLDNPALNLKLRGGAAKIAGKGPSANENYIINMVAVRAMGNPAASVDGEVNPAIKNCSVSTLKKVMTLGNCLHLMGTIRFDDCVMDACLLEKNLGLPEGKAIAEAVKEEDFAAKEAKEGHAVLRDLRKEHNVEDKENKAAAAAH